MPINTRALEAFRSLKPSGVELDDAERLKKPNNGICDFILFEKDRSGQISPSIRTSFNPGVKDPAPVASYGITGRDAAAFKTSIEKAFDQHKAHLFPTARDFDFSTKAQFNSVVGGRVTQFIKEAADAISSLPRSEKAAASKTLDEIDRRLWDRDITFDEGADRRMDTYGPYNQPQVAFLERQVAKFEAIDKELLTPAQRASVGRAHQQAQRKLDIIRRDHWVAAKGSFKSSDGEQGKGGALIDTQNRQRISVDPQQDANGQRFQPRYVTMNVQVDGNSRAVFWDQAADKYFFDKTSDEVPANLIGSIQKNALPADATRGYRISARPVESGEQLRRNFPFDQTRRGEISNQPISWLGWAGLCHNQAMSEANGAVAPKSHPGHTEYVSSADREFKYDAGAINGLFLEIPDLGSKLRATRGWGEIDIGEQRYGGFRRNEEPGRIDLGGITIPNDKSRRGALSFQAITKADGTKLSSAEFFRPRLANQDPSNAEKYTSAPNPDYVRTTQGDSVEAKLDNTIIDANVELERYGSDGYPRKESKNLTLDLKNRPDEDVIVDAFRTGFHQYAEVTVNLGKGEAKVEQFKMVKKDDGSFAPESTGSRTRSLSLSQISGVREANIDDPQSWIPLVEHSRSTGEAIVFESADNYEIWNSRLDSANRTTRHGDESNVTTRYTFDSKFGSGSAKAVYDRTADGQRTNHTGIDQKGDFWWLSNHSFRAFGDGHVNAGALQEGLVEVQNGVVHADMFTDMSEILHAAFRSEGFNWSIVHDGKRYLYDDQAKWSQDKATLSAARAKALDGADTGGGAVTVGEIHKSEGALAKGDYHTGALDIVADGTVTLKLKTNSGDADLYVNVGDRAPSSDAFDHRSWESGTNDDGITLDVKKGDKISFAVHGWEASNFSLTVTGPKAA